MKKLLKYSSFLILLLLVTAWPNLAQAITSATITWTAPSVTATAEAAVTYNVYHSANSGGVYVKVNPSPVSALTYVDTVNLSGFWEITAVGADGKESARSVETTFATFPPGPPTGLKVVAN